MTTYTNDFERGKAVQKTAFTITDWTEDYALDCNTDVVANANNVLGTLIRELIRQGIIKGSVTTA